MYFIYCIVGTMLLQVNASWLSFSACIDNCNAKCQCEDVGGISRSLSSPRACDCILICPSECQHHLNRRRRNVLNWLSNWSSQPSQPSYFCKGTRFNVFNNCISQCNQDRCSCQEINHDGGTMYYCTNRT